MASLRRPDGPHGSLLLGSLPAFGRNVLEFFIACARDHGDISSFRLGVQRAYHIAHPDLIEQVLVTHNRSFRKHRFFWRQVDAIFGRGLLTAEGEHWLRQRRLAAPAFHRDRINGYGEVMIDFTEKAIATWREGETRDVHRDMMRLTMDIVTRTLFAVDLGPEGAEVGAAFDTAVHQIAKRLRRPIWLPDLVPTPGNLRYRRTVERLDQLVYRIVEQRRRQGQAGDDLLSMLLAARDEDGSRMTDRQIRDQTITLFLAGHETTAITLSWIWYLLGLHPQVDERLRRELDTNLGDRPLTPGDIDRLPYARRVVQESMRMYPPAYAFGREAIEPCELAGWPIPRGAVVYMSPWVVHHDPRWFPEPEQFDPDRWQDDPTGPDRPRFAYFPFGGGPRLCIGHGFAMMEAVLLLATIARRFRLDLVPDHPVRPFPSITLRPEHGIRVTVRKR